MQAHCMLPCLPLPRRTAMPDCYRSFVCVENAQFSSPVTLKPGEFWRSQCEWGVKDL